MNEELFAIECEDSESKGSSDEVDDTDEDPDYNPSHLGLDHVSFEDKQLSTSTGRPRRRPPTDRPSTSFQNRPTPSRRRPR